MRYFIIRQNHLGSRKVKILYNQNLGSYEQCKDSTTHVGLANCATICEDYQWIVSFDAEDMGLYQEEFL